MLPQLWPLIWHSIWQKLRDINPHTCVPNWDSKLLQLKELLIYQWSSPLQYTNQCSHKLACKISLWHGSVSSTMFHIQLVKLSTEPNDAKFDQRLPNPSFNSRYTISSTPYSSIQITARRILTMSALKVNENQADAISKRYQNGALQHVVNFAMPLWYNLRSLSSEINKGPPP